MSSSDNKQQDSETPVPAVVEEVALAEPTGDMGEDGGDEILTMQDVLDEQEELEKEYAAVLGGSDHKCCTYSKV